MSRLAPSSSSARRCRWTISGQVQGVGFRPFVYRLAQSHGLVGWVRNDVNGVTLEAQGNESRLRQFADALETEAPPLARIERIAVEERGCEAEERFRIADSGEPGPAHAAVAVDSGLCDDCRRELFDPADRRRGHPLITCTNCGPRYTIIQSVPYDRPTTTMAGFGMCPACEAEYHDPTDRRFHAQPIACHDCGPRVSWGEARAGGEPEASGDPIATAARRLLDGRIVAIKGLGGFHLAVRADEHAAVARLRMLKRRDAKPFALMAADEGSARGLVELSEPAWAALRSPAAPIVLGAHRAGAAVDRLVAPTSHRLGVMLPYTPMHHLLFAAMGESPPALVMTSGNVSDEPIAIDNDEARDRLGPLCDGLLWHDRPIARCVDDSVLLDLGSSGPLPLRRSRGFVPTALPLVEGEGMADGLCVGGDLKCTVAVVRDGQAIVSQHLGDLQHPLAFGYFRRAIADLCELFSVEPRWVAHDLHPAYVSTGFAQRLAAERGLPAIGVAHHAAHAAAVLAERGDRGPALAVVCDGVGYGMDGGVWGGELLAIDAGNARRLAHLRPLALAGGDAAAKDTRRCALGLLYQAYGAAFDRHPAAASLGYSRDARSMLSAMIRRGVRTVPSTAMGRVFDGVAALLGVCEANRYEAEAPSRLEAAADGVSVEPGPDAFALSEDPDRPGEDVIDVAPLVRRLVEERAAGRGVGELAALFHAQVAAAWAAAVARAAERVGRRPVVLSGGVMANRRLSETLSAALERRGLEVWRHHIVPAGDGGLSLGQAQIAAFDPAARR